MDNRFTARHVNTAVEQAKRRRRLQAAALCLALLLSMGTGWLLHLKAETMSVTTEMQGQTEAAEGAADSPDAGSTPETESPADISVTTPEGESPAENTGTVGEPSGEDLPGEQGNEEILTGENSGEENESGENGNEGGSPETGSFEGVTAGDGTGEGDSEGSDPSNGQDPVNPAQNGDPADPEQGEENGEGNPQTPGSGGQTPEDPAGSGYASPGAPAAGTVSYTQLDVAMENYFLRSTEAVLPADARLYFHRWGESVAFDSEETAEENESAGFEDLSDPENENSFFTAFQNSLPENETLIDAFTLTNGAFPVYFKMSADEEGNTFPPELYFWSHSFSGKTGDQVAYDFALYVADANGNMQKTDFRLDTTEDHYLWIIRFDAAQLSRFALVRIERNPEEESDPSDPVEGGAEPAVSDPEADVETYWDYAGPFESMDLTGPWNEVILAVAETQLGYAESTRNFAFDENGEKHGWTRYGDWYGMQYADWCAMFVSFCLNMSGITEEYFPYECGTVRWVEKLQELGLYAPAEEYTPIPGDIVFFDFNEDDLADHVGIFKEIDGDLVVFIEGNGPEKNVKISTAADPHLYDWSTVLGYGILPERPEEEEPIPVSEPEQTAEARTIEAEGMEGLTITGTFPENAFAVAAEAAVSVDKLNVLCAYDISLYDEDGNAVKPDSPVSVSIPLNGLTARGGYHLEVYYIPDEYVQKAPVLMMKSALAAQPLDEQAELSGETESPDASGEAEETASVPEEAVILSLEEGVLTFQAKHFSVYAIVEVEDPTAGLNGKSMYIHNDRFNPAQYFGSTITDNNPTKVTKTRNLSEAQVYLFTEQSDGTYTLSFEKNGETLYLGMNPSSGAMSLDSEVSSKNCFTIEDYGSYYYLVNGSYAVNQYGGQNGKGFAGWTGRDDGSKMKLTPETEEEGDILGLDGLTYGIINYQGGTSGRALKSGSGTSLTGLDILVRQNPIDRTKLLLDARTGNDIIMWTFTSLGGHQYQLSTEIDGTVMYLSVNNGNLSLTANPGQNTELTLSVKDGMVRIANSSGYAVRRNGNNFHSSTAVDATTFHYLVDLSAIQDEDFTAYTAEKVSVSDPVNVYNGQLVVLYTRVWNEETLEYDYYAVDHDGNLVRAYDTGDNLEWIGSEVNTMLWEFTEYYYEGTTTPNYYYELRNTYSGKYIAPQITGGQTLSDQPIGIIINGRHYGDYYSPIIAWDDPYYDYAGLKIQNNEEEYPQLEKTLTTSSLALADDFYFAVMQKQEEEEFSTIETVDNNTAGISMHMFDYSGNEQSIGGATQISEQYSVITGNGVPGYIRSVTQGLVSKNLSGGYPVSTGTGASLSSLFTGGWTANHLFSQSTYEETGYYVYSCFDNYAYFDQSTGNFTVYNQLGTPSGSTNSHFRRGNFMPFNDLSHTPINLNYYDGSGNLLDEENPRYAETLYRPEGTNNFYFGMSMEASFMQTPSGLDAWGHDIIFDFYGDDDFWLYVDDMLVLDLGGIHDAHRGTVNFRTGDVNIELGTGSEMTATTLYDLYSAAYIDAYGEEGLDEFLNETFREYEPGRYCFRDYTSHTMKVFYMERGAGASNLYMRFNLTTVDPGVVTLEKKVAGTDKMDYTSLDFAYQVFWRENAGSAWIPIVQEPNSTYGYTVTMEGTRIETPFEASAEINGVTYSNVFYLRPGQSADIHFPISDDRYEYYIQEVGVNSAIYNPVLANGEELSGNAQLSGTPVSAENIRDFAVEPSKIENRKRVSYTNTVDENSLKTLLITKRLFAEDGVTELTGDPEQAGTDAYDPTTFRFRVMIGEEGDYYRVGPYRVKNPAGYYCTYVSGQGFVSTGFSNWNDVVLNGLENNATFHTSVNGAIDYIPAGYTVEIAGLLADTYFKIEERDSDIPDGYIRRADDLEEHPGYERDKGSYVIVDSDSPNEGYTRYSNPSPHLFVNNQRGWGLTIRKVWTDADFMESHEDVFFGVYAGGTLVDGTLRRMTSGESSLYYNFDSLIEGTEFSDYVTREVVIVSGVPETDEDGYVTNTAELTVSPVEPSGNLILTGTPKASGTEEELNYTVLYDQGDPAGPAGNIREDTVTNTRPGIRLIKRDRTDNSALAGASFTFYDANGNIAGAEAYTSNENGFIAVVYPAQNMVYTLRETDTPAAYSALETGWQISMTGAEDTPVVTVASASGDTASYEVNSDVSDMAAEVILYNSPFTLAVRKVDMYGNPMRAVQFALYREVTTYEGEVRPDYYPISGYENLVTNENGIVPKLSEALPKGTYYLRETRTPAGYNTLSDVRFTISETGNVSCANDWMILTEQEDGTLAFEIRIPNTMGYEFAVTKFWRNVAGSAIEWPKRDGSGIPITLTLTRRNQNGETDSSFQRVLTVTSDGISIEPADDSLVLSVTGSYLTGFRISVVGLEEKDGQELDWVYVLTEEAEETYSTVYENTDAAAASYLLNSGTVTNTPSSRHVRLKKVDVNAPSSSALEGAQFELYSDESLTQKAKDAEGTEIGTLLTNGSGLADIGNLDIGDYYLVETQAPAGYVIKASPVQITVHSDGRVTYDDGTLSATDGTAVVTDPDGTEVVVLSISNSTGYELPSTGGIGSDIFRVLGGFLILSAGLMILVTRRRKAYTEQ